MRRIFLSILGLFFITYSAFAAIDEEFPNRTFIRSKSGMVRIKKTDSSWVKAEEDMDVVPGDMVKTLSNGKVELVLAGTAVIRVNPDSEFTIPVHKDNRSEKASFIKMIKGVLFAKAKKEDDSLKIATPTAICGVRGTEFVMEVRNDLVTLTVTSGAVAFVPLVQGITPKATLVSAGQQMAFKPSVARKDAETKQKKAEEKKKEEKKEPAKEQPEAKKEGEQPAKEPDKKPSEPVSVPDLKGAAAGTATEALNQAVDLYHQAVIELTGNLTSAAEGNTPAEFTSAASQAVAAVTAAAAAVTESAVTVTEITQSLEQVKEAITESFSVAVPAASSQTISEITSFVQETVTNTAADIKIENVPETGVKVTPTGSGDVGQVKVTW